MTGDRTAEAAAADEAKAAADEAEAEAVEAAIEAGKGATDLARELFLESGNLYGCAEATFVALKRAFGLPDAEDSSAAMALNGGIAYTGGTCGAVTGAALAVGMLAERRIPSHRAAKRAARLITADLLAAFEAEFGTSACRELIAMDLRTVAGHRAFIRSGVWRDRCWRQVQMAVARLAPLGNEAAWDAVLEALERDLCSERGRLDERPPRTTDSAANDDSAANEDSATNDDSAANEDPATSKGASKPL